MLLATLAEFCTPQEPNNVQVMLYFDEAHELGKSPVVVGGRKTRYDIMWSTLFHFNTPSVFTVFLSTQSSMSLLAPSAKTARSSRQHRKELLQAPITETPFDCHPSFPLRRGQYGLADLKDLAFLARFGRPLYVIRFIRLSFY